MIDVGNGQAKNFNFGQLSIGRLSGEQTSQQVERMVHRFCSTPFTSIRYGSMFGLDSALTCVRWSRIACLRHVQWSVFAQGLGDEYWVNVEQVKCKLMRITHVRANMRPYREMIDCLTLKRPDDTWLLLSFMNF